MNNLREKQSETRLVLCRLGHAPKWQVGQGSDRPSIAPDEKRSVGYVSAFVQNALAGSFQHTLAGPAIFAGIGLHTGEHVRLAIRPAPSDHGVVFVRTDVKDRDNVVPATAKAVCRTQLGTVITNAAG